MCWNCPILQCSFLRFLCYDFWLLRKEFTLNWWRCPGGISRHKVQFWGVLGWGGVGRGVPHLLLEAWLIILLFAWCILSGLFLFLIICPHKNLVSHSPCRQAICFVYSYISLVLLVFLHLSRFEVWECFWIADYLHKLSLLLLLRSSHYGNEACSKFGGVCVHFGMFQFLCL
jgi:hypothetical protein